MKSAVELRCSGIWTSRLNCRVTSCPLTPEPKSLFLCPISPKIVLLDYSRVLRSCAPCPDSRRLPCASIILTECPPENYKSSR